MTTAKDMAKLNGMTEQEYANHILSNAFKYISEGMQGNETDAMTITMPDGQKFYIKRLDE